MDLRELQKSYLDNLRKVTEDKLEIGSLVRKSPLARMAVPI